MALYKLIIDTNTGITLQDIRKHLASETIIERIDYEDHLRDMTLGWSRIATVHELVNSKTSTFRDLFPEAGVYALCYEPNMDIVCPVLAKDRVAKFGETIRDSHHRIYAHTQALKGNKSNVYDSWKDAAQKIKDEIGCDIYNDFEHMTIWVRPHSISDPHDYGDIRHTGKYSAMMEKMAQAFYKAFTGKIAPANNRDLPSDEMVEEARRFIANKILLT